MAGDKETLAGQGLDARTIQNIPQLLAARPIYRPDLNLSKQNMSSQRIFVMQRPQAPGWDTPRPQKSNNATRRTGT